MSSKFRDSYKPLSKELPVSGEVFFNQVLERFDINLNDPANQVIMRWEKIAGQELAAHSRCDRIENNILYVSCDHPTRAAYIRLNCREILKNIKSIYPEIDLKKIVTRIIALPETP